MYKNDGQKIMMLAQLCGWICLIGGTIAALIFWTDDSRGNNFIGSIIFISGIVSFLSSWALYGFGQLVDDVNAMRNGKSAEVVPDDELPEL